MQMRLAILIVGALFVGACTVAPTPEQESREAQPAASEAIDSLPRMIAVHADYCPVCKRMDPLIESLTGQCDRKGVRVEVIDAAEDKHGELLSEHRIVALPTYLFIDEEGHEVARLVGAQTEDTLRQALGALRGESCPGLGVLRDKNTKERV